MAYGRRLIATSVTALVLSLVFTSSASAATISPDRWAPKFCGVVSDWQSSLRNRLQTFETSVRSEPKSVSAAKAVFVKFLDAVLTDTNHAVAALDRTGSPNAPNGKKIEALFVDGLRSAASLFKSAKSEIQHAQIKSLRQLGSLGKTVGAKITKGAAAITKSSAKAEKLDTSGKLAAALGHEPKCASAIPSGSGSGSSSSSGQTSPQSG